MINEHGEMEVYLVIIDYGPDEGSIVDTVHDTYEGAVKALEDARFRNSYVYGSRGAEYVLSGKKAEEYPIGYIEGRRVRK